jgi:hypothetical protein
MGKEESCVVESTTSPNEWPDAFLIYSTTLATDIHFGF